MRILLLVHSFNSLAQRLHVELIERGHQVSVELDVNDAVTREGVALFDPDIVLAAFLKRAISEDIWRDRRCLIVHPGIIGDGGPSALDWAVLDGRTRMGRDRAGGRGGAGCRAGMGVGYVPDARCDQVEPLSPRSDRCGR